MKNAYVWIAAALLTAAWTTAASAQLTCGGADYTFDELSGNWEDDDNWDPPSGYPSDENIGSVCIPGTSTVTVIGTDDNARADGIIIVSGGSVIVNKGKTLELSNGQSLTSVIDGDLTLNKAAASGAGGALDISADQTTQGSGDIIGSNTGLGDPPTIDGAGHWTTTGSLVVRGHMDLLVDLENDAQVIADDGVLLLSSSTKSGTGDWVAESSGTLKVSAVVSGTGTWKLINSANATIQFTTANTTLDGDILIRRGTLDIDANVDICGILTFQSTGGSKPRIEVASGVSVIFGQ